MFELLGHLLQNDGDCLRVDFCRLQQALDGCEIVVVDRREEFVNLSDQGEFFENKCSFEVFFVHFQTPIVRPSRGNPADRGWSPRVVRNEQVSTCYDS